MPEEQLERIMAEAAASMKLSEERLPELRRYIKRIGNMVLIRCCRQDIPSLLEPVIAQMAEDMMKEETGDTAQAVSSVTRGDTSISYRNDASLEQTAAKVLKSYEAQLRHFKKMNLVRRG